MRWMRSLLGIGGHPQYAVVGCRHPGESVRVTLESEGILLDVTSLHAVASLRPLVVAISLPSHHTVETLRAHSLNLRFSMQCGGQAELGDLRLDHRQSFPLRVDRNINLFRVTGSRNRCASPPRLLVDDLVRRWIGRNASSQHNFIMSRSDLHALYVIYSCPRPVMLVTVQSPVGSNMFPMDLIGKVDDSTYTLALRSTSPSVSLIQATRKIALSRIAPNYAQHAYALGKHHRQSDIDWGSLPFPLRSSATFGLHIPADALTVLELAIADWHRVGSHTMFVAETVAEQSGSDTDQMCHIQGYALRHFATSST